METEIDLQKGFSGLIQNTATGEIFMPHTEASVNILSQRECEILKLIEDGLRSKEIANLLNISKNTVNRHRQNIMEKLRVNHSIEAIKIAKSLKLID